MMTSDRYHLSCVNDAGCFVTDSASFLLEVNMILAILRLKGPLRVLTVVDRKDGIERSLTASELAAE